MGRVNQRARQHPPDTINVLLNFPCSVMSDELQHARPKNVPISGFFRPRQCHHRHYYNTRLRINGPSSTAALNSGDGGGGGDGTDADIAAGTGSSNNNSNNDAEKITTLNISYNPSVYCLLRFGTFHEHLCPDHDCHRHRHPSTKINGTEGLSITLDCSRIGGVALRCMHAKLYRGALVIGGTEFSNFFVCFSSGVHPTHRCCGR